MYFSYDKILEIPNTLDTIIKCWLIAEESLRRDINICYPNVNEEFITQFFHGKFAAALMFASEAEFIENAFLADLDIAFPNLHHEVRQIANGLIAEATLHKRSTESITGGDMGFVILRPQVSEQGDYLKIRDYKRGILCQAKLKRASGKWGGFTKKQISILPQRLQYLALLLYSYEDDRRSVLLPFLWQRCQSTDFSKIQNWVKSDSFPELEGSDVIIAKLGYGIIGTDNEKIVNDVNSPANNPSLVIRITWPEDRRPGGPGSKVRIFTSQQRRTFNTVKIRH